MILLASPPNDVISFLDRSRVVEFVKVNICPVTRHFGMNRKEAVPQDGNMGKGARLRDEEEQFPSCLQITPIPPKLSHSAIPNMWRSLNQTAEFFTQCINSWTFGSRLVLPSVSGQFIPFEIIDDLDRLFRIVAIIKLSMMPTGKNIFRED